jgi:urate oxidase
MTFHASRRSAAVTGVAVFRVFAAGDRDTVRDLQVDVTVAHADVLPVDGSALRAAVHALAPAAAAQRPEQLATAVAHFVAQRLPAGARVEVAVTERAWRRLDIGVRPRDRDFAAGPAELRTAHVTLEGTDERVSAGIRNLDLLTTSEGRPQALRLDVRWTYGWLDVSYDTQWQQIRRALIEAHTERRTAAGAALAEALGCAVLEESPAVRAIDVRLHVHDFAALDLAPFGMQSTPDISGAPVIGAAVYTATVSRDEDWP